MKTTLVLLLILAMCGGLMFSCGADAPFPLYTYENAARYTAGPAELTDSVQRIDIDWRSGTVAVRYHDEDYIAVTEENGPSLSDGGALHYWLDGNTLRIRYAKSGSLGTKSLRDKDLTVLLPSDTALKNLSAETTSADISVQGVNADRFELESVSGNMELLDVYFAGELDAEAVSGSITVSAPGNTGSLDAETTSGHIDVSLQTPASIDLSSTSGTIAATLDSIRGESSLESLSGRIELYLPEDAAFTARVSTLSGRLESDFLYNKAGDVYICGGTGPEFDIETLSGNVSIFTK